ncbi:MAG: cupin domain-containing protein [Anaerolineae bacterium]|nr:cupin domain-containing protein [Anaerolineae bacterium]
MSEVQYVFPARDSVRYRFPTHTNDLIMDRSQAECSEAFIVLLEPGEAPPLHVHPDTEQIFYVLQGTGVLQIGGDDGQRFPVKASDLVRIPAHTPHSIRCSGAEKLVYLSVDCFVAGRPQAEPTWDSHVRVLCEQNGWRFDEVRAGSHERDG